MSTHLMLLDKQQSNVHPSTAIGQAASNVHPSAIGQAASNVHPSAAIRQATLSDKQQLISQSAAIRQAASNVHPSAAIRQAASVFTHLQLSDKQQVMYNNLQLSNKQQPPIEMLVIDQESGSRVISENFARKHYRLEARDPVPTQRIVQAMENIKGVISSPTDDDNINVSDYTRQCFNQF
ncbi:unnamed protein product [Mytilus edulis]|uniref:Uncharacterized protein n=1 Tax=Mytilus edulis TaxID=6550 RepID=A0A8S3RK01_MYTED|nr:unnamed protein product [Mytilus edulis]